MLSVEDSLPQGTPDVKVLVTGGAGFCGSHVADRLIEAGYQVVVVDDLSTGKREHLNPKTKFYQADIRTPDLLQVLEAEKPDYVSHHAAQISIQRSLRDPLADASTNILGSLNLLEACCKVGIKKFIYISTGGAVYGEPIYVPCDEEHPVQPLCHYGASKHAVEHYLHLYGKLYGLNYTILRYPNIYGPRQDPHGEAGVVAIFTQRMLKGAKAVINGSGEQERDFLYVGDAAEANLLALQKGDGGIYNLGWCRGVSIKRVFGLLKDLTGYTQNAVYGPAVPEVFKICLEARRALEELGWEPRVSLEEGLRRTVEYFRSRAG